MQAPWYFNKFVKPYLKNKIEVSQERLTKIHHYVNDILCPSLITRQKYQHYTPKVLYNAFNNGTIAESGLEIFLNVEFINWEIKKAGEEELSDLKYLGLNVGVKSVKMNNGLPLIYPNKSKFPEIITIIDIPFVYIIGYATIPMLKYYQSPKYVWGEATGEKNGYWGFHKLHEFKTLEELKKINNDSSLNSFSNFTDTAVDFPDQDGILRWSV